MELHYAVFPINCQFGVTITSRAKLDQRPIQSQNISENLGWMRGEDEEGMKSASLYVKDTPRWWNEINVYEENV